MISEKKRAAAIANAKLASAAVRAKVKDSVFLDCPICGVSFGVRPSHAPKSKFCSRACMAMGYAELLVAQSNPNWKNAGWRTCETCGQKYKNYNKQRRFCSLECRDNNEDFMARMLTRKDKNHDRVVAIIESYGQFTRDMTKSGGGVPDLLIWGYGEWRLVEIKNPEYAYGKRGLSSSQNKWANNWRGGPVYIIRTDEEAHAFGRGDFHLVPTHTTDEPTLRAIGAIK